MTQIDNYWNQLFSKYNILNNVKRYGFHEISSNQIKQFHEARLMTKFDSKENLPKIFSDNKISILPITRGKYILGNFDAYKDVSYSTEIENIPFSLPSHIETIDSNNLYSESSCLHCAFLGRIFDDIAGEETLPTISGRMSGGQIDFSIRNILNGNLQSITTQNSQIEIDGGFESSNKLIIIEAKKYSVNNFLIRQLYYPYKLWTGKINKEIIPVFMTFSNDIFSFFIYKFINNSEYNSIELVEQKNYFIASEAITLDDIFDTLTNSQISCEPDIPFPQADSMPRIIDLLGILYDNTELNADFITSNYAFTSRQTAYYTTAARYLGLVDKRKDRTIIYSLSELGKQIMRRRQKQKYLSIVEVILKHEVFNKVLKEYFQKVSPVPLDRIVEIMNTCNLYNINSQNTVRRRAVTVTKWIDWILNLQNPQLRDNFLDFEHE